MFIKIRICLVCAVSLPCTLSAAMAQSPPGGDVADGDPDEALQWTSLPTDRLLRMDAGLPLAPGGPSARDGQRSSDPSASAKPPPDLLTLLRPRVDSSIEWELPVNGLSIRSFDTTVQMPLYPVFGPPPPLVNAGYSLTDIEAPASLGLPDSLHEFSLGIAWMRRLNDEWMTRFMLNGAFASDLDNTSSDAWQIRGGAFALYQPDERWSFALGALATGRADIPVIPAIGAVVQPSPQLIVNLMMPSPRVSWLLKSSGRRQHWGYLGGGMSGGTWAYQRIGGFQDRLTYREWRVVLGWEARPPQAPGTFPSAGTRLHAEVGYVFARKFEYDSRTPDISVDNALMFRTGFRF